MTPTNPHLSTYASGFTGFTAGQWLRVGRGETARRTRARIAQDAAYRRTAKLRETP